MIKPLLLAVAVGFALPVFAEQELAFEGATGFGAYAKGGKGGRVIEVTRLDDNVSDPQPGMFRWAVMQKGPRIVKFAVAGTVLLTDHVVTKEPFITIDGRDAPGMGVCLRGGNLEFKDTHDIILRYFRIRLGDETVKRKNKEAGLQRPKGSDGLDCISLDRSHDAIIDHVSASWCCDEVFSVVHCQNVTTQWCLLSEPLSNPELHPYGNHHAFCFNSSADTMSVYHCLFAHYVMRGPQFEANDMRSGDDYQVQMEAVNNVMFDYEHSGSRYTAGIEDHKDQAAAKGYAFQFIGNVYIGDPNKPAVQAAMKHEVHPGVRVFVDNKELVKLGDTKGREGLMEAAMQQLQPKPLFVSPVPIPAQTGDEVLRVVLAEAGCSHQRDAVDLRVLADVKEKKLGGVLKSQEQVGGWPDLTK